MERVTQSGRARPRERLGRHSRPELEGCRVAKVGRQREIRARVIAVKGKWELEVEKAFRDGRIGFGVVGKG